VVTRDLNGEAVLLDLETGRYYGLDPVGTRMWELLSSRKPVSEVAAALQNEYDVEEKRLVQDLDRLVQELSGRGLLREISEAGGEEPGGEQGTRPE